MALGTFVVTIDGNRLGAGTEKTAQVQVRFASGREFVKDTAAGLFWFPHLTNPKPQPVSLPHTVTLVTDVTTGVSAEIGYEIIVTTAAGGTVNAGPFPAQAANTTIDLTDVTADFTGTVPEDIAVRAETARDEAETAAASIQREQPNGVAGLDASGKVYETRLPDLTDTYAEHLVATTGDEAATINAFLAAGVPLGAKKKRLVGDFTIGSTVTVPAGVQLDLSAATITHTVAAESALSVGAGAVVFGGKITSPATWDGTNTAWTYAVIEVTGAGAGVHSVRLQNVPKVGIGVRADDCTISGCRIEGNYPTGQWTGVETVHFGITLDPSATTTAGNLTVTGNIVKSCVQGIFVGPYDGGGPAKGVAIAGNAFEGCWNHGVYAYGDGIAVSGNSFNRCQIPVATSGPRMSIVGNTMVAQTGGTDQRDVAGISCREAIGCVVADNIIRGNAPAGSVIVDIRCSDTVVCSDNIIHDNTIDVAGGSSQAIRVGANATTCENNVIHNNVIRSAGALNLGIIAVTAAASAMGLDNRVHDNTIIMRGATHGILLSYQDGCVVAGNKIRLEHDAVSAVTLGMVALNNSTIRTEVRNNSFKCTSAWGTNITIRAVYEFTGVTDNVYRDNEYRLDTTKLTAAVRLLIQGGSRIHESGPGAPSVAAIVGSTWIRTDGGAATTFYVKESGTSTSGWVGK